MPTDATHPPAESPAPEVDVGDVLIIVELDGAEFAYRPALVTPKQASQLRLQSAWRLGTLTRAVFEDDGTTCGPEEIAGLVFMARLQAGEPITYDEVASRISGSSRAIVTFDLERPLSGREDIDDPES